jgi:hypothetical protein
MYIKNVHGIPISHLLGLLLQLAVMGFSSCSEYLEIHAETSLPVIFKTWALLRELLF